MKLKIKPANAKNNLSETSTLKTPWDVFAWLLAYIFSKASGINVWDLEGKKYTDMIFAVGQNTLMQILMLIEK